MCVWAIASNDLAAQSTTYFNTSMPGRLTCIMQLFSHTLMLKIYPQPCHIPHIWKAYIIYYLFVAFQHAIISRLAWACCTCYDYLCIVRWLMRLFILLMVFLLFIKNYFGKNSKFFFLYIIIFFIRLEITHID